MRLSSRTVQSLVRNVVFGVEDSLVSTVGFLAGIATANVSRSALLLSGVVLIAVEALSMGIGSALAEVTVEELRTRRTKTGVVLVGGGVMFLSYVTAGCIPLLPYVFLSGETAFYTSIGLSLIALCVLGWMGGSIGKADPLKTAIRMTALGGMAILTGILIGRVFHV